MWRPAARTTGTNDVPIGNKRRFGLPEEAPPPSGPPPPAPRPPASDIQFFNGRQDRDRSERDDYGRRDERPRDDYDRRRDDYRRDDRDRYDERREPPRGYEDERERGRERERESTEDGPRKRRSRWGDAKADVTGLPVAITGNVSQTELDNYAIHVRLEEINRKLRNNDVVPPDGQRSPSPPPQYDAYGRRTNTREIRYRKKLEDERARLVDRAMKSDPNFKPPADFANRRGGRPQDKVYIPVKEFPEINFFGLLVGPRGNSLKRMERESGAKISIRGKGSVKEGKGRPDAFAGDEEDELHCLVMAEDEAKVKACVDLINKVIETAASTPEGQNDHKRHQLRELASLNGTLRDDENQLCQNCGEKGHRRWECPQQRVYSANVICRLCGGAGHMARDCRGRGDPNLANNKQTAFDSEYSALMAELGEGGGGGASSGRAAGVIGGASPAPSVHPWRLPENWQGNPGGFRGPPGGDRGGHGGYRGGYHGGGDRGGGGGGYNQGGYGGPGQGYGGGGGGGGGYGGDNGYRQQDPGYGGGGGAGGPPGGAADPYAAYYASMGQGAPQAA